MLPVAVSPSTAPSFTSLLAFFLFFLRAIALAIYRGDTNSPFASASAFDSAPAFIPVVGIPGPQEILLNNSSPDAICYKMEFGWGVSPISLSTLCDQSPGFWVPANKTVQLFPGEFTSALTTMINATNTTVKGSRHEFAFEPEAVYYDMDYEFGSSNSTLGPSNSALHTKDSLRGEENILGLANDHWGNAP